MDELEEEFVTCILEIDVFDEVMFLHLGVHWFSSFKNFTMDEFSEAQLVILDSRFIDEVDLEVEIQLFNFDAVHFQVIVSII